MHDINICEILPEMVEIGRHRMPTRTVSAHRRIFRWVKVLELDLWIYLVCKRHNTYSRYEIHKQRTFCNFLLGKHEYGQMEYMYSTHIIVTHSGRSICLTMMAFLGLYCNAQEKRNPDSFSDLHHTNNKVYPRCIWRIAIRCFSSSKGVNTLRITLSLNRLVSC